MSRATSRSRRRKLKAHDSGQNRHNRGLAWMLKRNRLASERNLQRQNKETRRAD